MKTYIIAVYDCQQRYGGPEEGGWWYDSGSLVRITKRVRNEGVAYAYCQRLNHRLRSRLIGPNQGKREYTSVLSDGEYQASIWEDTAPRSFPDRKPHYEIGATAIMAHVIEDDLEACTDCLMAIANGDYSGMDDATEKRVRAAIDEWSKRGTLVPSGGEDDEEHFSWQSCDVCDSHLGGNRSKVALLGDGGEDEDDQDDQDESRESA